MDKRNISERGVGEGLEERGKMKQNKVQFKRQKKKTNSSKARYKEKKVISNKESMNMFISYPNTMCLLDPVRNLTLLWDMRSRSVDTVKERG